MKILDEHKSEELLAKELNVVKSYVFSLNEFKEDIYSNKYPIFVKIISDKAVHKVKSKALVEITSETDFKKQKPYILKRAKALNAKKIIIQEKIYGDELIIGIKEDEKFGKLFMLGLGGKYAEQLKDVSFRVLPIQKKDFVAQLKELKNQAIIKKIDENKLWLFVTKLICFAQKNKNILFIDLNPVIIDANTKKPIIVDARVYLKD
jgi:hypothetical protein